MATTITAPVYRRRLPTLRDTVDEDDSGPGGLLAIIRNRATARYNAFRGSSGFPLGLVPPRTQREGRLAKDGCPPRSPSLLQSRRHDATSSHACPQSRDFGSHCVNDAGPGQFAGGSDTHEPANADGARRSHRSCPRWSSASGVGPWVLAPTERESPDLLVAADKKRRLGPSTRDGPNTCQDLSEPAPAEPRSQRGRSRHRTV